MLLKTLANDFRITITLSTPTKDIGIGNKYSAPTSLCDNKIPLKTELVAFKSFTLEQFFLTKNLIQEFKDLNHETGNSIYIAMIMEQVESLKNI